MLKNNQTIKRYSESFKFSELENGEKLKQH
jgi:hypothetical protein